eukprot:748357-Hanusia_phi.AAC.2
MERRGGDRDARSFSSFDLTLSPLIPEHPPVLPSYSPLAAGEGIVPLAKLVSQFLLSSPSICPLNRIVSSVCFSNPPPLPVSQYQFFALVCILLLS